MSAHNEQQPGSADLPPLPSNSFHIGYSAKEMQQYVPNAIRQLAGGEPAPVACKWPTCQSEAYQDKLADEIHRQLYSGEPAPVARELDVEAERRLFREVVRKLYEPHMGPDWEIMLDRPQGGDFAFKVWRAASQATAESAPASAAPKQK